MNAAGDRVPFGALVKVARKTTDDEVAALLASDWRPRVMGAWLASSRARRLEGALLKSLETSSRTLTAPPLATVALDALGAKAVPWLNAYLLQDIQNQWGSAPFIAAVPERLDAAPNDAAIEDDVREVLGRMLIVARRLAEIPSAVPPKLRF